MKFRRGARLDTSEIDDRRGSGRRRGSSGAGGLGGLGGLGGGAKMGGAGVVVVIIVIAIGMFAGVDLGGSGGTDPFALGTDGGTASGDNTELAADCQTGEDANQRDDCRIVAVVNSVQDYWSRAALEGYQEAPTVFFDGLVDTGCGEASSAVGPFYCPADRQIYIDLGFYEQLESQLRRARRRLRRGLRDRPRVRAPRAEPARPHRRRRPRRSRVGLGAPRAPGRLLRRRLGGPRPRHRAHRAAHPRRHR